MTFLFSLRSDLVQQNMGAVLRSINCRKWTHQTTVVDALRKICL